MSEKKEFPEPVMVKYEDTLDEVTMQNGNHLGSPQTDQE